LGEGGVKFIKYFFLGWGASYEIWGKSEEAFLQLV